MRRFFRCPTWWTAKHATMPSTPGGLRLPQRDTWQPQDPGQQVLPGYHPWFFCSSWFLIGQEVKCWTYVYIYIQYIYIGIYFIVLIIIIVIIIIYIYIYNIQTVKLYLLHPSTPQSWRLGGTQLLYLWVMCFPSPRPAQDPFVLPMTPWLLISSSVPGTWAPVVWP